MRYKRIQNQSRTNRGREEDHTEGHRDGPKHPSRLTFMESFVCRLKLEFLKRTFKFQFSKNYFFYFVFCIFFFFKQKISLKTSFKIFSKRTNDGMSVVKRKRKKRTNQQSPSLIGRLEFKPANQRWGLKPSKTMNISGGIIIF